jgi:hypothetical protein
MIFHQKLNFSCFILSWIVLITPLNPQDHFIVPNVFILFFHHLVHLRAYYRFIVSLSIFNRGLHQYFFMLFFFLPINHACQIILILLTYFLFILFLNFQGFIILVTLIPV